MNYPTIKTINLDFLSKPYFSKSGDSITFKSYEYKPPIEDENLIASLKELNIIEAFINKDSVGYIILGYIVQENKEKHLPNAIDWIIHTYGNNNIKKAWKQQEYKTVTPFLSQILNIDNITSSSTSINTLQENIKDHALYIKYSEFVHYWVNKPNVELIYIYNQGDKYKDFSEFPFMHSSQTSKTNYRGNGIAQTLHEVAGLWMQSKNMYIHSSNKYTEDGKMLWQSLSKLPQFKILVDSHQTTLTNDSKTVIKIERSKLFVG